MSVQTVWKAGNSLVITMTKRCIRKYRLQAGSLVRIEEASGGCMRLRPIDRPLGSVSRPSLTTQENRTRALRQLRLAAARERSHSRPKPKHPKP